MSAANDAYIAAAEPRDQRIAALSDLAFAGLRWTHHTDACMDGLIDGRACSCGLDDHTRSVMEAQGSINDRRVRLVETLLNGHAK